MEHLCEIILNLDQWFKRCPFKICSFFNSVGHFVQWSRAICAISIEGIEEHSCEIILNLDQWFRCYLKKKFTHNTRKAKTCNTCQGKTDHNSSPCAFGSGEFKSFLI